MKKEEISFNLKGGLILPDFNSLRNWTEDYGLENGNYICHCHKCKEYFFGHKRRNTCRECSHTHDGI